MEVEIAKFRRYGEMKSFGVEYKEKLNSRSEIVLLYLRKPIESGRIDEKNIISFLENFDVQTIGLVIPGIYSYFGKIHMCKKFTEFAKKTEPTLIPHFYSKYGAIGDQIKCIICFSDYQHSNFKLAEKIFYFTEIDLTVDFIMGENTSMSNEEALFQIFNNLDEPIEIFKWKLNNIPMKETSLKTIMDMVWSKNNNYYYAGNLSKWSEMNGKIIVLNEVKKLKFVKA